MTPTEQEILRASLELTTEKFFRKRAAKAKVIIKGAPAQIDATGLLVVLAAWAGDLIKGAPEHMRDPLFLSFADSVVTIAEIKAEEDVEAETVQ